MADVTECPVCFEEYRDPKLLPCNHTLCLKCLGTLDKKTKKQIICPMCNAKHRVPDRGVKAFTENQHAVELVASRKKMKEIKALKEQMETQLKLQQQQQQQQQHKQQNKKKPTNGASAVIEDDEAGKEDTACAAGTSTQRGDANVVTFSRQKLALIQCEYDPKCCSHCKKSVSVEELKQCMKCKTAKCCSRDCQVKDWKGKHKAHCKEIERLKGILEKEGGGGPSRGMDGRQGGRNGQSILLERGPEYYHACIDGNKLIVMGAELATGRHSIFMYDTTTGAQLASRMQPTWEATAGMCIAENNNGESLLAVSLLSRDTWRIELWSSDFTTPQLLSTLRTAPGVAGPPSCSDGELLVANAAACTLDIYDVSTSRIKSNGLKFLTENVTQTISNIVVYENKEDKDKRYLLGYQSPNGEVEKFRCYNAYGTKLWEKKQQVHRGDDIMRTSACTDGNGNVYVASSAGNRVSLLPHQGQGPQPVVVTAPGPVWCMDWCKTTNKLWVVHYSEDKSHMMASAYDVNRQ